MVQRAQKKLFLDTMVNRGSTKTGEEMDKLDTKEMLKMLSFGMNAMFAPKSSSSKDDETTFSFTDAQIDRLIDRKQTVSNFKTFGHEDDDEEDEEEKKKNDDDDDVTLKEQRVNLEQFNENENLVSMTIFEGEEYRDKDSSEKKRRRRFETINKDAIQTTKRKRKKRVVMVDGFEILKSNMYVIVEMVSREPTDTQHTQQVQLGGRRTVRHGKRSKGEQTKDLISCVCSGLKT